VGDERGLDGRETTTSALTQFQTCKRPQTMSG
jgi:hypothetical protein